MSSNKPNKNTYSPKKADESSKDESAKTSTVDNNGSGKNEKSSNFKSDVKTSEGKETVKMQVPTPKQESKTSEVVNKTDAKATTTVKPVSNSNVSDEPSEDEDTKHTYVIARGKVKYHENEYINKYQTSFTIHERKTAIDLAEKAKDEFSCSYHVYDNGEIIYTAKFIRPDISHNYYVGTGWENDKCVGRVQADNDLEFAKRYCISFRNAYKKTYYVFDNKGEIVFTAEYKDPYTEYYRVGSSLVNGSVVNLTKSFKKEDHRLAREEADKMTTESKSTYFVYDIFNKPIYKGKER
jgi:hypothetical protein